ncbi:IclR family transcriptional regulator [Leucobacter sp. CSA2]|uniref:IclR family transcriptional regulator n=1 Tax=Leucobacter edaphi TaxID=2796472 RepID=A0A934UXU8_9MICO|nr:IclR family transcriptional regulator [Leucobacter edaphi]MBK0422016.1 IclR family transcriptional regulator [Leucobacter edaphi]
MEFTELRLESQPRRLSSDAAGKDRRTSVDKAVCVLKAFGDDANVGVGVSELSRRADLSKSTTFRLLAMLEKSEMVERIGTAYRFGPAIQSLGGQDESSRRHDQARDLLTPFLADLFVATRLTVQLAVLEGQHVIYLNKLEGHQRLRTPSRIGGHMPAYCTGVGKVFMAFDPAAEADGLRAERHRWTPNTIVDEQALRVELARVRVEGIAHDRGESLETLNCIAAPVMSRRGVPLAALSVSGRADAFRPQEHEHTLRQVALAASRAVARFEARLAAA